MVGWFVEISIQTWTTRLICALNPTQSPSWVGADQTIDFLFPTKCKEQIRESVCGGHSATSVQDKERMRIFMSDNKNLMIEERGRFFSIWSRRRKEEFFFFEGQQPL